MDILLELTQTDVQNLCNFYENNRDYAPHVVSFLHNAVKWNKTDANLIRIYAPNGNSHPDGTFIAVLSFNCYDLFMFTMDKSCLRLSNALKHTQLINWKEEVVIIALHEDLHQTVLDTLRERQIPISFVQENALWIRNSSDNDHASICPNGYSLGQLITSHATLINEVWPYRYEGSENYIKTLIDLNGGLGVFSDGNNELIAWVMRYSVGMLGILQTKDGYKKRGFGASVLNSLCKDITLDGFAPMAVIAQGNEASQAVFTKCGFQFFAKCHYIGAGKPTSIAFDSDYDFTLRKLLSQP